MFKKYLIVWVVSYGIVVGYTPAVLNSDNSVYKKLFVFSGAPFFAAISIGDFMRWSNER